ncbi:protein takeout [Venturia canescens]|uniref:protein takeout n=1 Tax=Venturia canescens TaxID=32260 RepID=UPI001C9CA173|nr:protein takeout [Venturia canescens]
MVRSTIAVLLALLATTSAVDLPEFIKVCNRNDPELDACITGSVDHLRPYLVEGVPEYNLPSLEPLVLEHLVVSEGQGIKLTATEIKAYGASNFIVKKVESDMANLHYNVDIELPHLYIEGHYEIDGRLLLLQVTGSGPLHGNFTECLGQVNFDAELYDEGGEDHFRVKTFDMKITVGQGNLQLDNLFGGEKVLGDVVNNAINANFDAFVQELLPLIEKALSDFFLKLGNNIVTPFAFDQLFPV